MTTPSLTNDEVTALNSPSQLQTFMKPFPATEIATAEVNGTLPYPIAVIPTTNESAGWTDIKKGMTVIIETAAGLADVARFRVRADVSATGSIKVGEFGKDDTGAVAFVNPIPITGGQLIRVVNTRDIHAVFPRIDYGGGTTASIYEDFDRTDIVNNLLPSPIVNIKTNNSAGGHYGVKVADGGTVSITAVATVLRWPTSTSESYAWSYPAEFTSVSGASTSTLTATAPVGNWEISCTVTPDLGAPITAVRYILVCDTSTNPPIPIASIGGDTRNRTARRISLDLNDTAVWQVPDGAGVIVWDQPTWAAGSVPTATSTFVGWISRAGFSAANGLRQAGPEIVGIGEILNMLTNSSQLFEVANIPTVWQQMGYQLATYNWCIWWILTYRASNVLTLFNFEPYSTSATVGRLPAFDIGNGTLLNQVQSLAARYRKSNVGSCSGGEIVVAVPPHMIEVASRGSLITRAELTASHITSISLGRDVRSHVRQVEGLGFSWDGVSALPTPYKSISPQRPAQGSSDDTLDNQIVASQAELNAITGLYRSWVNTPIQSISIVVAGNWDVIEPVEMTLVSVTIPADVSPMGADWTFDAVPISVSKRRLENGAAEIEITVEPLTSGSAGTTVVIPPPGTNVIPDLPPIGDVFPTLPPIDWGPELPIIPDEEIPLDPQPGAPDEYPDIYLGTQDGHAAKVTNGAFTDISPHAGFRTLIGTVFQLVQDAWNYSVGYMVGSNAILRGTAITGTSPSWQAVIALTIIPTDPGDYDFTVGDEYGWEPYLGDQANWTGAEWESVFITDRDYLNLEKHFSTPVNLVSIRLVGNAPGNLHVFFEVYSGGSWHVNITYPDIGAGPFDNTYLAGYPLSLPATGVRVYTINGGAYDAPDPHTITHIELTAAEFPIVPITDELIIGAFTCHENKKGAYCWLSKKTVDSVMQVMFNQTLDNFATRQQVPVARYADDMVYSIAVNKHNWRFVHVTAGDPAEGDAFVYKSVNGGGSFTVTDCELLIHGGQLFTNWSTGTPNTPNITSANLIIVRGLDGSDDLLARRGLSGSDEIIATGSGKYGLQPDSLYQLARDGDFLRVALQDNSVHLSDDFGADYDVATSTSGTQLRGVWLWPTDDQFGLLFGDEQLEYTVDEFSTYEDMWTAYDSWRGGVWGSEGTVIVSAWIDLGQHYIRPVASEA